MCKLSIITINYNNENGLEKTLSSVTSQTFTDFEQIVIDGESSDGSIEIIKLYEPRFNDSEKSHPTQRKFLWVSEKDTGVYHAQNKGILKAKGEYCFFLNSGDYLTDNSVLAKIFACPTNADIIWGNLIVRDKNNNVIGKALGKSHITFLDVYNSSLKHQSTFIKRTLFEKYGLYDETLKIVGDWEFFLRTVGFNLLTIEYINLDIAYFNNDGISYNNPDLCENEKVMVLNKYMPEIMQKDYKTFSKYLGVFIIDKFKWANILFRILFKISKFFIKKDDP